LKSSTSSKLAGRWKPHSGKFSRASACAVHINKYTDPWNQITDKLGGRVIVKTLDDLAKVRAAFEQ